MVHVDLIGLYSKSIIQQQPGGAIIKNNVSLAGMIMIDPAMGWFEIFEVPLYDLHELMGFNDEYIDHSSARVSQIFNNKFLSRYLCPRKVVFDNGYEFK